MSWRVVQGDCVELMTTLEGESIDAIVCDPPYGLGFMGRQWDDLPPGIEWAAECLRVLKPGGHLLAFGGTRTYHRLACAVEDAGFEVRDCITWLYGSGFPKSLDVSKAIDKAAGAERTEVTGVKPGHEAFIDRTDAHSAGGRSDGWERDWRADPDAVLRSHQTLAPATPDAVRWQGWGTALKPASEPIVVARKPLVSTVAGNVLQHGTGALNVDGCRVRFAGSVDEAESKTKNRHADFGSGARENAVYGQDNRARGENGNYDPPGRWPANVVLSHAEQCVEVGTRSIESNGHHPARRGASGFGANDGSNAGGLHGHDGLDERHSRGEEVQLWACVPGCPVRALDEQTGVLAGGGFPARRGADGERTSYGAFTGQDGLTARKMEAGGASRFFYCAKASGAERNAGLDGFAEGESGIGDRRPGGDFDQRLGKRDGPKLNRNVHPTVKPVDLMRWLVRLVTPPSGVVLDPFTGSGTTGVAAVLEGFEFVGLEREPEYVAIAEARIGWWAEQPPAADTKAILKPPRKRALVKPRESLF